MKKVAIVGSGNLGSCIAYEIANRNLVDELVLIDVFHDLAEGNAADIRQGIAFRNNTKVFAGNFQDAMGSQVVVVTAGKPRTQNMKSRMDLLKINKNIIFDVAEKIKKHCPKSIIVTLTNPVDIMNFLMWKKTGFDRRRILGSAGMLDSARFRNVLKTSLDVSILDLDAYVMGEHGEYQVPVFSQVKVKGKIFYLNKKEKTEIIKKIKEAATDVISKKGATIYAPANNTANILQMILCDEKKAGICSVVLQGEYGIEGVSLGVPIIIGQQGVEEFLEWQLSNNEKSVLLKGTKKMRNIIKKISF
jgi:malate dehydrogenase